MEKANGIRLNLSIEEDNDNDNTLAGNDIVMHTYRPDDEEGSRLKRKLKMFSSIFLFIFSLFLKINFHFIFSHVWNSPQLLCEQ